MKLLFSLVAVLLVGTQGQKSGRTRGKKARDGGDEDAVAELEDVVPWNASVPFNETDKTQFSRRQWMEIAINKFFDDFETGITENAQYLFAQGAPYISNGALYAGLDMSNPATWAVIPPKSRVEREFSVMNRTETWVRCLGVYPDGRSAIEFTSFTFDRKGMITTMSKVEAKECPTAVAPVAAAPTATPAAPEVPPARQTPQLRADTKRVPDVTATTTAASAQIATPAAPAEVPPARQTPETRADTKRVPDVTATTTTPLNATTPVSKLRADTKRVPDNVPTASPTSFKTLASGAKGKGKGKV
jgi:hypothetical protein